MNSSAIVYSVLLAFVICLACSPAQAEPAPSFPEFRGMSPFGLGPQKEDRYNSLFEAIMMQGGLGRGRGGSSSYAEGMAPSKRQLRYHQCYFNPVSCFKRK